MSDAANVYADHFAGRGTRGAKDFVEAQYLVQGGDVVIFDLSAAQIACVLFRAQAVPDADRYTPQELLQFMHLSDRLLEGMTEIAEACAKEEDTPDPLAPSGSGAPSSPTLASAT